MCTQTNCVKLARALDEHSRGNGRRWTSSSCSLGSLTCLCGIALLVVPRTIMVCFTFYSLNWFTAHPCTHHSHPMPVPPLSLFLSFFLSYPHIYTGAPSSPSMSSHQPPKKKTVAQLRAEKEQCKHDFLEDVQLVAQVAAAGHIESIKNVRDPHYDELNALLPQANQTCQLLQHQSDPVEYAPALASRRTSMLTLGSIQLPSPTSGKWTRCSLPRSARASSIVQSTSFGERLFIPWELPFYPRISLNPPSAALSGFYPGLV